MSDERVERRKGERRMWIRRPDVYDGQANGGKWRGRRHAHRRKKERRRSTQAVRLEAVVPILREMSAPAENRRDNGIWHNGGSVILTLDAAEALARYVRPAPPTNSEGKP